MFDGTDLSAAYGTSLSADIHGASSGGFLQAPAAPAAPAANFQLPPPPQTSTTEPYVPPPAVSPASMSHATPPDAPYYPPNAMYAKGGSHPTYPGMGGDSMWDKLSSKKYDVLKLVLLSLVILLAMSSDRVIHFYLGKYISGGIFTAMQEFLIRLSYPLVILVLLWILKANV